VAYHGTVQLHRHGLAFVKGERRAGVGGQVTLADRIREHLDRPSLDTHDPIDRDLVVSSGVQRKRSVFLFVRSIVLILLGPDIDRAGDLEEACRRQVDHDVVKVHRGR
jgi:hypothetical protein